VGSSPGRLRNVRLAALNLREISRVDLEGPGILGFSWFSLNSRVLTFCLNVSFMCKSRRIQSL